MQTQLEKEEVEVKLASKLFNRFTAERQPTLYKEILMD